MNSKDLLKLLPLPFFIACGSPPPPVSIPQQWPVEETLADWDNTIQCRMKDWDLRIESFGMPNTYARTLGADSSIGPVRSTTIYAGSLKGDPHLFHQVLIHELVHAHAPAANSHEHTEGGIMDIHIEEDGKLLPETIEAVRAWCALNPDAVTFYGDDRLLASNGNLL